MKEEFKLLESQIREIYGRVVYTHKTHEKSADILKRRNNYFKHLEIILSAITCASCGTALGVGLLNIGKSLISTSSISACSEKCF